MTPPARDLLAGQAVIDDALDGAATVGLDALSDRVESLREEFLATTVHDIRQPITLVTGSLDLAARWLGEPEFDRERITDVVKSAVIAVNEINIMLDTLGDASRLAMGALEPDPEPAKLDAIVADALALLDAETRRQIDFEPSADPLVGLWDPHLLRRVVSNLISNALKYSPGGGRVEIHTERAADGIGQLTIRDQGMGLTTDEAGTVFDRFVRADRARAQGIPGLGLGLYACRGIVAAHDGTLVLHSDGPGTRHHGRRRPALDRGRRRRLTSGAHTGTDPTRNTLARQPRPTRDIGGTIAWPTLGACRSPTLPKVRPRRPNVPAPRSTKRCWACSRTNCERRSRPSTRVARSSPGTRTSSRRCAASSRPTCITRLRACSGPSRTSWSSPDSSTTRSA